MKKCQEILNCTTYDEDLHLRNLKGIHWNNSKPYLIHLESHVKFNCSSNSYENCPMILSIINFKDFWGEYYLLMSHIKFIFYKSSLLKILLRARRPSKALLPSIPDSGKGFRVLCLSLIRCALRIWQTHKLYGWNEYVVLRLQKPKKPSTKIIIFQ